MSGLLKLAACQPAEGRGREDSMSQECRLVSMHGLLRLLRLLIR
eukprot:COSAG01_NODE_30402_length_616_cov_2.278530_1_plen_43_part_10